MRIAKTITVLLLLGAGWGYAAEEGFPGVKKLMSAAEFTAAGLDKLSDAERNALNQWLISYTVQEAPTMRRNNETVKKAEESLQIVAQLIQPFNGWSGDTVFKLDNGQVWRQRLDGRYPYHGSDTRVVIKKNFFGFYKMTLLSTDTSIGVTRVK